MFGHNSKICSRGVDTCADIPIIEAYDIQLNGGRHEFKNNTTHNHGTLPRIQTDDERGQLI